MLHSGIGNPQFAFEEPPMRRLIAPAAFVLLILGQTGCSTMNNTEKGVGLGGLLGAGVGTAIGAATGNPKTGAVVGTLAGAGLGGIFGNDVDPTEKKQAEANVAAASYAYDQAQPGRIDEIVLMAKNGQSERVIINHIHQNRLRFVLTAVELNDLKANSVPDAVIVEMQNSTRRAVGTPHPRPVIVHEEVIYREPVYIRRAPPPVIFVDPYCPPGFGTHYRR